MQVLSTSEQAEPTLQAPLKIAIRDAAGFSPFSIAVLRGHYELAKKIVEICLTQYHKDDGISSRKRWTMRNDDDDDDEYYSEDDSEYDGRAGHEHLPIFAELVSDNFTIDNLGEVATVVKSDVLPLTMIEWDCYPDRLLATPEGFGKDGRYGLLRYSVETDNMEIFKFIMKLGAEQQELLAEDEDDPKCYEVGVDIFRTAIARGRTVMLGEMIKSSGAGVPLNNLLKDSGVEVKTKPKYYQGLSVGGKKRADWAQAPGERRQVIEETSPPLLTAAQNANLDSIEWFSSGAPLRKYKEFAEANKNDKRIKTLQSGKGLDKIIEKWLSSGSKCPLLLRDNLLTFTGEFILHAAVSSSFNKDKPEEVTKYAEVIKHLITDTPTLLEQKSSAGYTPLHFAICTEEPLSAKLLIEHGANQRNRDKQGRNLIHSLITRYSREAEAVKKIKAFLELFDADAIRQMLLERCAVENGALTPLGLYLSLKQRGYPSTGEDIVSLLAEYSTGEELEMINGEGDLPLHVVRKSSLIECQLLTSTYRLFERISQILPPNF